VEAGAAVEADIEAQTVHGERPADRNVVARERLDLKPESRWLATPSRPRS